MEIGTEGRWFQWDGGVGWRQQGAEEKQQLRKEEVLFPEPPVCPAGLGDGPVFGERFCRLRQEGRAGEGRGEGRAPELRYVWGWS